MKLYTTEARAAALRSLIQLEAPLSDAISQVSAFPWDWSGDDLAIVTRADLSRVLACWSSGQMLAGEVENWAAALECREDVAFESQAISVAIFELANPTLHAANSLDDIAARFLS